MGSILNWLILAISALLQAGGLPAAPAADTPALRQQRGEAMRSSIWAEQRIVDVAPGGYAQKDGASLSLREQARLYRSTGSDQARELLHQSQAARGQGVLALLGSPVLGAAAGYAVAQALPEHGEGQDHQVYGNHAASVYTGAGAVLGLGVGIGVLLNQRLEARELRAQAAESYNRQLLQGLNVWLLPTDGGAVMRLQKKF